MQLRQHPLMSYRGSPVWPPIWVSIESRPKPRGEVGLLKQVRSYPDKGGEIYLIIDYEETEYAGCLLLDDKSFSAQLGKFLQSCCGMSVKDIGSLQIPPKFEVEAATEKLQVEKAGIRKVA